MTKQTSCYDDDDDDQFSEPLVAMTATLMTMTTKPLHLYSFISTPPSRRHVISFVVEVSVRPAVLESVTTPHSEINSDRDILFLFIARSTILIFFSLSIIIIIFSGA